MNSTVSQSEPGYEGWALVEQMGFRKTYARVREVEQYGTKMLRMDVPVPGQPETYVTFFAGGPSLYQVTPLTEELARAYAERASDPRPVMPVGFRLRDERPTAGDAQTLHDDAEYQHDAVNELDP